MSDKIQRAFIVTLEMGLKKNFTQQAKLGWEALYNQAEPLITNYVLTGTLIEAEEDEDDEI